MKKNFNFRVNFMIENEEWEKFKIAVPDRSKALRQYIYTKNRAINNLERLENQVKILKHQYDDAKNELEKTKLEDIKRKQELKEYNDRLQDAVDICFNAYERNNFIPLDVIITQSTAYEVEVEDIKKELSEIGNIPIKSTT